MESGLKSGGFEAVASEAEKRLAIDGADRAAWRYLHHARMGERRFDDALQAIERAIGLKPTNRHYRKLYAICLKENGRFADSLALLEDLRRSRDDDLVVLDALKVCHYRLGNQSAAIQAGARRLELLDGIHGKNAAGALESVKKRKGKKVVAFGLWGRSAFYAFGAMVNARLVQLLLPGWIPRYYIGRDVAPSVTLDLARAGAEIIGESEIPSDVPRYMWRFLVADDPSVALFLCRDCDSRISAKEVGAVTEWLAGPQAFHVMRDHVFHSDLILAGLWGGMADDRLAMRQRIANFQSAIRGDTRYGGDQAFLAREIWPLIRRSLLAHDAYYALGYSLPFPFGGKGNDRAHVGAGVRSEKRMKKEARLFGLPWPLHDP